MTVSREDFFEKKLQFLEKRLTRVEHFIETRFNLEKDSPSLTVFSNDNDEDYDPNSKDETETPKIKVGEKKRRGRPSKLAMLERSSTTGKTFKKPKRSLESRPAPASVKKRAAEKEKATALLAVSMEDNSDTDAHEAEFSSPNPSKKRVPKIKHEIIEDYTKKPRYNTRRKPRQSFVDEEFEDDKDDNLIEGKNIQATPVDNDDDGEEEEGDAYFTFPEVSSPSRNIDVDVSSDLDADWAPPACDDDLDEVEETEQKPKVGRPKKYPIKPGRGRKRKPKEEGYVPPRKRVYVKARFENLPVNCIAASDPTRKECPVCHKHFKNEVIESHMGIHTKERHLKCSHCDKTYYTQSMLRKHMRVHMPEKYERKCRLCSKVFYQSDKILAHERVCIRKAYERNEEVDPAIVEDIKSRSSTGCMEGWVEALTSSSAKVKDEDSIVRKQCPTCNKFFKSHVYNKHLKSHDSPRSWGCNLCTKAYVHKHDLIRHVATEHAKNPVCDICNNSQKDRQSLKRHRVECKRILRANLKLQEISGNQANVKQELIVSLQDEVVEDENSIHLEIHESAVDGEVVSGEMLEDVSGEILGEVSEQVVETAAVVEPETESVVNLEDVETQVISSSSQASLVLVSSTDPTTEETKEIVINSADDELPEVGAEETVS